MLSSLVVMACLLSNPGSSPESGQVTMPLSDLMKLQAQASTSR